MRFIDISHKYPIVEQLMSNLRDITFQKDSLLFKKSIYALGQILGTELSCHLDYKKEDIVTPFGTASCKRLIHQPIIIPILRAGMSMVDGILKVMPTAKIGHIGLYRNEETLQPVEYYYKMPSNIKDREVFILDPMLATGGSAIATIDRLKKDGVTKINFLCVIAAPEGIEALKNAHKDVKIYCACVDRCLNENGYILPGLGDAGDRVYGTR